MGAGDACRPDAERPVRAGPPLGSARGPLRAVPAAKAWVDDTPPADTPPARPGMQHAPPRRAPRGTSALLAPACGLPIRPVLKHGPRSLTCVRADGC